MQNKTTLLFEGNIAIGRTIEDVWRDIMWACVRNGKDYAVKGGSYVGQIRRQLPYAQIIVEEPWTRPLAVRVPENCGFAPPTSEDKIHQYAAEKLLSDVVAPNEDYTYGYYIMQQIDKVMEHLITSEGNTNQACIAIGEPKSVFQNDPPCLRAITFNVIDGKLQMSLFFRSWDLFAGLPENLGGLQIVKEYVLMYLQEHFAVEDGPIVAFSSGLHLYEQYFPLVNQLTIDKIKF